MSQQCFACFGFNLENVQGVLICLDCGTQTQAQVEEGEYEEVGGQGASRRRAAGSGSAGPRSLVLRDKLDPQALNERLRLSARAHLHMLQTLLQAQAQVLVDELGVAPEVAPLMRHIWLSLVPHTQLLDYNYLAKFSTGDDEDNEGSSSEDGDDSNSDAEAADGQRPGSKAASQPRFFFSGLSAATRRMYRNQKSGTAARGKGMQLGEDEKRALEEKREVAVTQLWDHPAELSLMLCKELGPQVTLVIASLACLILKQPVTPFDIVRWALVGRLPYMDAGTRCASVLQSLEPSVAAPLAVTLSNLGVRSGSSLILSMLDLATLLQLPLPTVNGPLLLARAAADLCMPQEVLVVALELYRLYLQDSPLLTLQTTDDMNHPYCLLMTVLVEAVRMLYGLDGLFGGRPRFPGVPPPPAQSLSAAAPHTSLTASQPAADSVAVAGSQSDKVRQVSVMEPWSDMMQLGLELPHNLGREAQDLQAAARFVAAQKGHEQEQRRKLEVLAGSGWRMWAQARLAEHLNPSSAPISMWQARELHGEALSSYLHFCTALMDARAAARSSAASEAGTGDDGQGSTGAGAVGAQLAGARALMQQLAGGVLERHAHTAADRRAGPGGMRYVDSHHNNNSNNLGHLRSRGADPSTGLAQSLGDQPKDAGTDAEEGSEAQAGDARDEACAVYAPVPVRQLSSSALHPDLLAVVAVCGAYVNAQPEVVLKQLAQLEARMGEVELGVLFGGKPYKRGAAAPEARRQAAAHAAAQAAARHGVKALKRSAAGGDGEVEEARGVKRQRVRMRMRQAVVGDEGVEAREGAEEGAARADGEGGDRGEAELEVQAAAAEQEEVVEDGAEEEGDGEEEDGEEEGEEEQEEEGSDGDGDIGQEGSESEDE